MDWRIHLQTRLLEIRPNSICALDAAAHQLASEVVRDTPVPIHGYPPEKTCTLALGFDALNGLNAEQAQHLISQACLYAAPRILIAAQAGCALDDGAFRALGFTLSEDNGLDDDGNEFILRSISKQPSMRFDDAGAMTAALDRLERDWRARRDRVCRLTASESAAASAAAPAPVRLRSTPVKCDPERAASDFGVDGLWRPAGYIRRRFAAVGSALARDTAAGLVWQVSGSPYPIPWQEAHAHAAALNRDGFGGLTGWRVPTAPELISLLTPTPHGADFCTEPVFDRRQRTLWSSDRRSFAAAWFVNTEMGFVAWQDVSAGCYVRAVCSDP